MTILTNYMMCECNKKIKKFDKTGIIPSTDHIISKKSMKFKYSTNEHNLNFSA